MQSKLIIITLAILTLSLVVLVAEGQITCPDTCDLFVCETSVTQADCPSGSFLVKGAGPCGCCYGCAPRFDFLQPICTDPAAGISPSNCAPGLLCAVPPSS